METKELKKLAKKIAEAEKTIIYNEDKAIKKNAENKIFELVNNYNLSFEDMMILDEIIQKKLKKINKNF